MNDLCPSKRLEPVGAEGQLGSMAAGNSFIVPLALAGTQVQSQAPICTEVTADPEGRASGPASSVRKSSPAAPTA